MQESLSVCALIDSPKWRRSSVNVVVNAANALVFALLGVFCLLGATVANYIGLAWTLALGALGYPLYSAGLYCNVKFGNVWFVLFGAVSDNLLELIVYD